MVQYANIIIDISHEKLDKTFQYIIPETLSGKIMTGMQVLVPFGNASRQIKGYVVEITDEPCYDVHKLKEIAAIVEGAVPIESQLIALAGWMKRNYGATMNHALKTVIPAKQKSALKDKRIICLAVSKEDACITLEEYKRKHYVAKERLLAELIKAGELSYELVTGKLHISAAGIRALEQSGLITIRYERAEYRNPVKNLEQREKHLILNEEQQNACDTILSDYREGIHKTYLIHGVTGSGKTEVYMELIAEAIKDGKQAIVLIPEIALTYQTVMRFYNRFGDRISIMNSRLSPGERYDQYERAKNGEIDVMIGPRSALFTPFSNLGFIIIDEEHETSYKSETLPRYHARETAIERASMAGASVVLGSATPSVDSYYKALSGEYQLVEMKKRVNDKPLPHCEIIDLRTELKEGNRSILSRRLQELMADRLKKKQQMMLFINRRGMSGFVSCRSCGHVIKCPHCDVSLSLHRNGRMVCHYCGYEEPEAKVCPECGSRYISGFKAGTEKIESVVKNYFPEARVLRMDMDTTKSKEGHEKILSAFAGGEADILVGTQMIVKGHDFPNVTLVGVLAADLSLNISDYHAAERTFELLTQAAGRAGRGECPGDVVIQTYQPEHYSIQTAARQDYEAFYEEEIDFRKMLRYPPVWHMLVILTASITEERAAQGAEFIREQIRNMEIERLGLIGPADAAVAKIEDVYRKVIYLKHADYAALVKIKDKIENFMNDNNKMKDVIVRFDFDPMNGF